MDTLRNLVSRRVRFSYEDGTSITGYISGCRPAQGPVRVLSLSRAEICDASGHVFEQHRELILVASPLVGIAVSEGPSAQQP